MVVLKTATCVTTAEVNRHQASCRSTRQPTTSSATPFEFLHEIDERVDACFRKGIVDRGANATDGSMSLQAIEPRCFGLLDELFLQLFARKPERHVHQRPAVLLRGASVEATSIDFGVELSRLTLVYCRDRGEAALVDQPSRHEAKDIDREHRRRVVHRAVFSMHGV